MASLNAVLDQYSQRHFDKVVNYWWDDFVGRQAETDKRTIGLAGLVCIAFFWVHGGSYGNEAMILAGPPRWLIIGLITLPFLYSLPVALITAELSTALPESGGYVVWVREAFGPVIGGHHAYWVWMINLFDSGIYPVLAGSYIMSTVNGPWWMQGVIGSAIVVVMTLVKLQGTDLLIRLNSVIALMCMLPMLLWIGWSFPKWNNDALQAWMSVDGETNWVLLLSWLLWLNGGFFSLGSLAGEIKDPKRTFPLTTLILIPVVIIFNVLPVLAALSIDPVRSNYVPGYFTVLATRVAGSWLGWSFVVGAFVSLVGLYSGQLMAAERTMSWFVQTYFPQICDKYGSEGAGPVALWFFAEDDSETGVGRVYILANAALCGILVWLPYDLLVEFVMLQSALSTFFFGAAFCHLKRTQPDMDRPYCLPGGLPFAIVLVLPPLALTAFQAAVAILDPDDHVLGVPYLKVYALLAMIVAGVLAQGAYRGCVYYVHWRRVRRHGPGFSEFESLLEPGADEDAPDSPRLDKIDLLGVSGLIYEEDEPEEDHREILRELGEWHAEVEIDPEELRESAVQPRWQDDEAEYHSD